MLVLSPSAYRWLLRPLLFRLPAETAQKAADLALKQRFVWKAASPALRTTDPRLRADYCGIPLANPLGLAAGFDKNCVMIPGLASMGFGYLTVGTVTEGSRPGNAKPRMFRMPERESLINALGFPGKGLEAAHAALTKARKTSVAAPIVVSVSGTDAGQIVRCHRRLEPLAQAVEVNISSPNTAGLRLFHDAEALADLLAQLNDGRKAPLIIKLPPYPLKGAGEPTDEQAREKLLALARLCAKSGVDTLTVANTRPTRDARLAVGAGGLSGRAIFPEMLEMVADVRREVGWKVRINACGGIFTGAEAWQALKAGADTVQLYTALVYRGPGAIRQINRELITAMRRDHSMPLADWLAARRNG
ncbi:MAG: dihydroorotate dehydrogenase (quinone) [SAR202 cluster bacterium]|nr:dihydroorotate dehydrogenase (quinone) [SAR202 cluster bacterium]